MKRFFICVMTVIILTASLFFTACGGRNNVPDTDSTLEIYVLEAGYGIEWCDEIIRLFKNQAWVKEKYPNLNIIKQTNNIFTFAQSKMQAGSKNNTIDLFFGVNGNLIAGKDENGEDKLADLTEVIYNENVPGEDILYKDKIFASYLESTRFWDVTQISEDRVYYVAPWAGGMNGFLYNEDILNSLGIDVPNTTDELYAACQQIKALENNNSSPYNKGYSFIQSKDETYWDYLFHIWWAQYQGIQGYYDFWNGYDRARESLSLNIFQQLGRLETLKVYEKLLDYDEGFMNPSSSTYEFMVAQTMFLQGNGVFHVNGDWFDNEMRKIAKQIKDQDGIEYSIKMMRTPIISSIRYNTPSITSDAMLSDVIAAIDAGETSYAGVDPADFNKILEARSVVHSIGPNHTSFIPSYAKGKEIAVDFLRFMATDIACEAYIKSTKGASLPFKFDLKEKNLQLYNSLSALQKNRIDYFENGYFDVNVLPNNDNFPLCRFGGLRELIKYNYYEIFKTSGNTITPQEIFDETISEWTQAKWEFALSKAGIFG